MKFEYIFIAFGILAGASISLLAVQAPVVFKAIPALMWLIGAILVFDIAAAYLCGVSVYSSVSINTRVIAFCCGALALILSGGVWS